MRKIILVLALSLFVIVGCSNTSAIEGEKVTTNDSFGEQLLKEMQTIYENSDFPTVVLLNMEADFNKVKDENLKNRLVKLSEDAVIKMLANGSKSDLRYFFDSTGTNDINEFSHVDYLSKEVKGKIFDTLNPTSAILEKQNLKMETIKKYNDVIEKGTYRNDAITWLDNNGVKYEKVSPNKFSRFLVLTPDTIILEFDEDNRIEVIFKIKDSNGNVVSPFAPLSEEDLRRAKIQEERDKEIEELLYKRWQEQKEQKKVKIGMTQDEVVEKLGKPDRVNRTTTKYGINEQWVYGGNYIYFENGIVDTIRE